MTKQQYNIVFFDGYCGLCSEFVDFVLKIDKKSLFKFSPLQGQFASKHLPQNYVEDLSTVVVIIDGQMFTKALGVLALFRKIGGWWTIVALLRFLPKKILNFCYDLIARHRYRFMAKKETCRLPSEEEREKFIL